MEHSVLGAVSEGVRGVFISLSLSSYVNPAFTGAYAFVLSLAFGVLMGIYYGTRYESRRLRGSRLELSCTEYFCQVPYMG